MRWIGLRSVITDLRHSIRFFLIGVSMGIVDLIPGVSGGTLAFGYGIWERLINSIVLIMSALRSLLVLNIRVSQRQVRAAEWRLLVPIGLGVLSAAILGASVIGSLLETHPQILRAVFCGVVIGALPVPFRLVNEWTILRCVMVTVAIIISFLVSGIPSREIDEPSFIIIFVAAAISICATILPGLSGSFLLLIFGLYEVLINAIRERDFVTWGIFAAGAWTGAFVFTSFIAWLLKKYHDSMIAILIGLMIGGLRVLWPWLGADRELLYPTALSSVGLIVFWLFIGLSTSVILSKILTLDERHA